MMHDDIMSAIQQAASINAADLHPKALEDLQGIAAEYAARRAAGFWRLEDVVRAIVRSFPDRYGWERFEIHMDEEFPLMESLVAAIKSGELAAYEPNSPQPINPAQQRVIDRPIALWFSREVRTVDVDAWLDRNRVGIEFRFARLATKSASPTSPPTSVEPREAAPTVAWRVAMVKQWTPMLAHHGGRYPGPADAVAWFAANDSDGVFVRTSDGDADVFYWIGANGKRRKTHFKTFQNAVSEMKLPRSLPV